MGEQVGKDEPMRYLTTVGEREYLVEIVDDRHIMVDGVPYTVDFDAVTDQPVFSLLVDGRSIEAYVYPAEEAWQVVIQGRSYPASVIDEREKRLRSASRTSVSESIEYHLKAPMPGLVVALPVVEGLKVKKGDVLVILESMKMQNELRSPRSGTVARIRVKAGDSVEQHQTLLNVS
jgi:biotin carboxyl carrier protein